MELLETKYLYTLLLLVTISFPLLASFESRLKFYKKASSILGGVANMSLLFIPWDIYFTKAGVWWFNHKYTIGLDILFLPLEEWLFFLFIPYACVFIYESANYYLKNDPFVTISKHIYLVLGISFILVSIYYYDQLYTIVTFSLAGLASLIMWHIKPSWGGKFLRMYLISWLPFLLINGALTGSFTTEAVVNYNPSEFIGLRVFTIPIEDSVYSFLMLLIVVAVFEKRK